MILTHYKEYLPEPAIVSFWLSLVSQNEITKVVLGLKNSAPGLDKPNISVIKACIYEIAPVLPKLINISFRSGEFPEELKLNCAMTTFKQGQRLIPDNCLAYIYTILL